MPQARDAGKWLKRGSIREQPSEEGKRALEGLSEAVPSGTPLQHLHWIFKTRNPRPRIGVDKALSSLQIRPDEAFALE